MSGNAYDNAMAESYFATLEYELLHWQRFLTQVDARMAVFDRIEAWARPAPAPLGDRLPLAGSSSSGAT